MLVIYLQLARLPTPKAQACSSHGLNSLSSTSPGTETVHAITHLPRTFENRPLLDSDSKNAADLHASVAFVDCGAGGCCLERLYL